jgi:two-component system nitrogen regulation response regulator GlnG/two-component system response regulator HydG
MLIREMASRSGEPRAPMESGDPRPSSSPMPVAPAGTTTLEAPESTREADHSEELEPALVLVWSESEPRRVGEVLLPSEVPSWFGRSVDGDPDPRLQLLRQRPGANVTAEALQNPFLSRRHLRITRADEGVLVECFGKRPLRVGEAEFERLHVRPGDAFELRGLYVFLCVARPLELEKAEFVHEFGAADAYGIVGESPAAWELRARIAFTAARDAHVLITGPSGTGKELVARAIHECSTRRGKALVARNASTFPTALIDAELFGNLANYPNAGMPERPGLVGQADRSTLFLDEIGELPVELQAHLLRVLDSGEYQRLGDARPRASDLRLVAATNRAVTELKEDLAARLVMRIEVPGLGDRLEDVPLLARHIVGRIAARDPQIGERYLRGWNGQSGELRMAPDLVRALVLEDYTAHVRELEALIWRSMQSSRGSLLELTPEVRAHLRERAPPRAARDISAVELRAALTRHGGVKDRVWRELGLSSRHALHRLMKKLGEA